MVVVGLGHRARQGKDTLANRLCYLMPEIRRYAFADALKSMARFLTGMPFKHPPFLQALGLALRTYDDRYWIKQLKLKLDEDLPEVALITDVRFGNEVEWVQSQGGLAVRVDRVMENGSLYVADDRDPNHPSETLNGVRWDTIIKIQNGDLDGFDAAAKSLSYTIRDRINRQCAA